MFLGLVPRTTRAATAVTYLLGGYTASVQNAVLSQMKEKCMLRPGSGPATLSQARPEWVTVAATHILLQPVASKGRMPLVPNPLEPPLQQNLPAFLNNLF